MHEASGQDYPGGSDRCPACAVRLYYCAQRDDCGENGLFQNTPLLSAVYEKMEEWTAGTYIPVISYAGKETEKPDILLEMEDGVFPVYGYIRRQQEGGAQVESAGEYEMILRAQAQAEENKRPRETESEASQTETPAGKIRCGIIRIC